MMLAHLHEKLLAWASDEARKPELLAARRAHFDARGEPHEEDRTFDARQNAAIDHYLYDHRPAGGVGTTLARFITAQAAALSPEELAGFEDLGRNVHGLFEVRKLGEGSVRLRDVFTGGDHDVTERRQTTGLEKGDLFEARLLPHAGLLFFSGAFLHHPREARKAILAEVKRLRKAAGRGGTPDVEVFLAQLSRMALKLERYRNVRLESIYDFSAARG